MISVLTLGSSIFSFYSLVMDYLSKSASLKQATHILSQKTQVSDHRLSFVKTVIYRIENTISLIITSGSFSRQGESELRSNDHSWKRSSVFENVRHTYTNNSIIYKNRDATSNQFSFSIIELHLQRHLRKVCYFLQLRVLLTVTLEFKRYE